MEMLWFWLVSVFSVSPAEIRETALFDGTMMRMGVSHV